MIFSFLKKGFEATQDKLEQIEHGYKLQDAYEEDVYGMALPKEKRLVHAFTTSGGAPTFTPTTVTRIKYDVSFEALEQRLILVEKVPQRIVHPSLIELTHKNTLVLS